MKRMNKLLALLLAAIMAASFAACGNEPAYVSFLFSASPATFSYD